MTWLSIQGIPHPGVSLQRPREVFLLLVLVSYIFKLLAFKEISIKRLLHVS